MSLPLCEDNATSQIRKSQSIPNSPRDAINRIDHPGSRRTNRVNGAITEISYTAESTALFFLGDGRCGYEGGEEEEEV
ncbi:hypothetical protein M7I_6300 [Glarea lozoyensis 74030]|uniref:Uncharacterized protein n=1 Tax=Glarea lozoyensis (strain ATCC 74030 / MF5533) TaxID=1104152 RepID=H0EU69_GLAL7|nr:hypothetical protein M7I_6300 [Glarea lozoyensis 74030]